MSLVPPSSLMATKQALAESLREAGWNVEDHVPAKVQPPLVIIEADDPYVTEGETFGDVLVMNLQVHVIARSGSNSRETYDLDRMLEKLLPCFGDWGIEVGQPESLAIQQNVYFGCSIKTSHDFTLTAA